MKGKDKTVDIRKMEGDLVKNVRMGYDVLSDTNIEHLLIQSISNPIWSVGGDGKLVSFNSAFIEIFKLRFKIEPEKGLYMLNLPLYDTLNSWLDLFNSALQGNKCSTEFVIPDDKLTHYYYLEASPVIVGDKIGGVVFISTNITNRKTAENGGDILGPV